MRGVKLAHAWVSLNPAKQQSNGKEIEGGYIVAHTSRASISFVFEWVSSITFSCTAHSALACSCWVVLRSTARCLTAPSSAVRARFVESNRSRFAARHSASFRSFRSSSTFWFCFSHCCHCLSRRFFRVSADG